MRKTVWKYSPNKEFYGKPESFTTPKNSVLLSCVLVDEIPQIYFLADSSEWDEETHTIIINGTGEKFPDGEMKFLGTLVFEENYVQHAFEILS